MAVTSATEIWDSRQGSIDQQGQRSYTREYRVITDDWTDGPKVVRQATGIPRVGDPYAPSGTETDTAAVVTSVTPRQNPEHPTVWLVRVEYRTRQIDPLQANEDPLDRPAQIEWSFVPYRKVVWEDIDNNAIDSSAGEPFDPPVEIDDSRPVLRITRNESGFDPARAVEYQDAVNDAAFFGGAVGQVKVASISASNQFEAGIEFWRVSYEFHFRREGWALKVLDRGFLRLTAGARTLATLPAHDASGGKILDQPVSAPILLDGAGAPLAVGGTPQYRTFNVYKSKDFSVLGLP